MRLDELTKSLDGWNYCDITNNPNFISNWIYSNPSNSESIRRILEFIKVQNLLNTENAVMSNKRRLLMKVENKTDNKFLVKLVKAAVHDTPYMDSDIVIKDYDLDRVYLDINGEEFDIRTWNISEIGNSKIEIIYTLFKIKEDCGVSIKEDKVVIKCDG